MTIDKFLEKWYDKEITDWGGYTYPEFKELKTEYEYTDFQRNYRSVIKDFCKDINMELYSFNKNHYEFSAVLKSNVTNKFYYISISDVRYWKNEWANHILYRTMEHEKDWTGGSNHYSTLKNLAGNLLSLDLQMAKKLEIESNTVAEILSEINPNEYKNLINKKEKFEIQDIIKILDEDEKFCKSVCQKYVNTMSKEMLLEIDNKVLHIYIDDDYITLKADGKININNYKEYLDEDLRVEEYYNYQELYNLVIKDNIAYDLNDLELFDENGKWNFYITFEELKKVGYGFMVKDQFPLIEKYAVPEDKIFEFFDYFSLEQLEDFEQSLNQYFIEESIIYHENSYDEFESKEDADFNRDILRLACGLITYEDFIDDYKEHSMTYYDLALPKVIEYFKENQIKDLMDYGCDTDEGLSKISSLYTEIMDKLNIRYSDIYTEDGASPGKYITTICFENNYKINVDTKAWEGIKGVTSNMESIYEFYEKNKDKSKENAIDMEVEF